MSPKRDFSGFAALGGLPNPPPSPAASSPAAVSAAPPTSARPRRSGGATAPVKETSAPKGRPGRQRICVSLTLETYELLAAAADARDCWKVELIIAALARWEEPLRSSAVATETSRFRRRRSSTPTPYVMDLTRDELARIDGLAKAASLSRSALVRQLILLEDEPLPASAPAPVS